MIKWHQILGNALKDCFSDTSYSVEIDKELMIKQFPDILLVEEHQGKKIDQSLRGLENLAKYNIITYKSWREPLDSWVIDELGCYYVLFRKIISQEPDKPLLSEKNFKLYGISTRFPYKLSKQEELVYEEPGIYYVKRGTGKIKIIVISRLPKQKKTALWQMFSTRPDMIEYGLSEYKWKREDFRKSVLNELTMKYKKEGLNMPYTEQDWFRDVALDHMGYLTIEERLRGLGPEERLRGLGPEERLRGLKPEEIKTYLKSIEI